MVDTDSNIPPPNYTQIPNIIFDYWMPQLGPSQFMVLMCICGWHKNCDFISIRQIMKFTGLSRQTVVTNLDGLEKLGLVTIERRQEDGMLIKKHHDCEGGVQ